VDLGDLDSTEPVSLEFGYDRGTPIDRFYIERFLGGHCAHIRGRALEVADPSYSERFGSGITHQDVLHIRDEPGATIVGDLSSPDVLPANAFDCILLTQTLQLIYDLPAAVEQLHRALAVGGVVLATVPGVSSIDRYEWGASWFWSLTEASARRLFAAEFGEENVEISCYGNVFAATCFLQGLATEEVDQGKLAVRDAAFPLVLGVRALKR
jgi:SAM-dependent methyltransferase